MICTLPVCKRRTDNEREVGRLGIWSQHMDMVVNGEQTDHHSAAFRQHLSNSWKPINTNCFELQLLLNGVREDKVTQWLKFKWFIESFSLCQWSHVAAPRSTLHVCAKETLKASGCSTAILKLIQLTCTCACKCLHEVLQQRYYNQKILHATNLTWSRK